MVVAFSVFGFSYIRIAVLSNVQNNSKMIFRIYRLPGSREVWHIDAGQGTQVVNVYGFDCKCASHAVDMGDVAEIPRAWIEVVNADLHIIDGIAFFDALAIEKGA